MSTKYLVSAIIMEMASFMKKKGIRASVEWAPREGNREADSLANGNLDMRRPSWTSNWGEPLRPDSTPVDSVSRRCSRTGQQADESLRRLPRTMKRTSPKRRPRNPDSSWSAVDPTLSKLSTQRMALLASASPPLKNEGSCRSYATSILVHLTA